MERLCGRRWTGSWSRLTSYTGASALPRSRVGFRTLAPYRQAFSMSKTAIRAGIDHPLDVHGKCFSQVAFDLVFLLDDLADLDDLIFTEILHADRAVNPGLVQDVS